MEIVYQETKDGERQLELWDRGELVCACKNVKQQRAIEQMVNAYNGKAVHHV